MNPYEIELPGEIVCCPITIQYLAKREESLRTIYKFRSEIEDSDTLEHLNVVLGLASDMICELCYNKGIDPMILDYWVPGTDYIATPFEPEIPK